MKIQALFFFGLFFSCFYIGAICKKNRLIFLAKYQQLAELGKQVAVQEERVRSIMQKIVEYMPHIKEQIKAKMVQKYPEKEITDEQAHTAFVQELTDFGRICSEELGQKNNYIANDLFFPNVYKPLDADNLMFKFYVASHGVELLTLCALLDEWEELKQEMIVLHGACSIG